MHKLFNFQPFGSPAMTSITCTSNAEPESLTALVRLFDGVSGFGQFRMFAKLGQGPNLDGIRLSVRQAALATALLESSDIEEKLNSAITAIRQEKLERAVKEDEVQRVYCLNGFEFGKLIEARSGGRLVQRPFQPMCILSRPRLLPVTHFKALARLTTYDKFARTFTLTAKDDCPVVRDKLLELATKISKSTKEVTPADIASRRAERQRKADARAISWDKIELMVEDVYGYVTEKNMLEMARKLGVLPSVTAPT